VEPARLSQLERSRALEELAARPVDVLVVGGGIVGAGVALDAVTRGLRVGLVEARDWASGTSSRSSKLVHGGLRYLEMLEFGLVREALRERSLLLQKLAPHLVKPVSFLYPLTHRMWERPYVGAGMLLYDAMGRAAGRGRGVPHHRQLSRRRALALFPSLRPDSLVGAAQYWDAQVDDARYAMTVVRTAVSHGALASNNTAVVGLLMDGDRVTGARVRDALTGELTEIRARVVVNATGVWTSDVDALSGTESPTQVRASKGVHLVVPRSCIDGDGGLILRTDKSVLFVIPWGKYWLVGTTDTEWNLDRVHPAASSTDVEYLLEHANRFLRTPLRRADVVGVYVGLRPLLRGDAANTAKLSREHAVSTPRPGMVTVAGGKYTTYRVMAADTVDVAARELGGVGRTVTADVPLVGAEGYAASVAAAPALAEEHGLALERVERLLGRYGSLVTEVLAPVHGDRHWGEPLDGAPGYLRAEVLYAATHEGACHLDDVLTRRTHVSVEVADRGVRAADAVADILGDALGWDEARREAERAAYRARVAVELESQTHLTDTDADRARRAAVRISIGQ
jgi:glycerol-3-phosphate dehydrogenase